MQRVWSTYLDEQRASRAGHNPHSRPSSAASSVPGLPTQVPVPRLPFNMNPLQNPARPFAQTSNSSATSLGATGPRSNDASSVSLTVNYLPSKFSQTLLDPGPRRRKKGLDAGIPKRGGGVEAFRSGEARMPAANDDDYDGVNLQGGWLKKRKPGPRKLRWNKFKWILFFSNIVLSTYSLVALVFCLLTWFNVFTHADILRVGNTEELIISTTAASLGLVTSVVGWAGILLNNRGFLAIYMVMLWITFAFLVAPGYMTYKRRAFNLEGKVNSEWSRDLGSEGRLRIQNQLGCCGYFSPFVGATVSQACFARSVLKGCKLPYMNFQRVVLQRWYIASFILVPLHIFVILAGLLCSNHVTYRFGKGMMPKAYRLSLNSMAVIMDNYATQLAEQYGTEVASDIMARSRTNLQVESRP